MLDQIRLPMLMVEALERGQAGDLFQVSAQFKQLLVGAPRSVRVLERLDLQTVGRIHQKVASQIIKHDGVCLVVSRKFVPDHTERFHL